MMRRRTADQGPRISDVAAQHRLTYCGWCLPGEGKIDHILIDWRLQT